MSNTKVGVKLPEVGTPDSVEGRDTRGARVGVGLGLGVGLGRSVAEGVAVKAGI